jgi:hypothetical protein
MSRRAAVVAARRTFLEAGGDAGGACYHFKAFDPWANTQKP